MVRDTSRPFVNSGPSCVHVHYRTMWIQVAPRRLLAEISALVSVAGFYSQMARAKEFSHMEPDRQWVVGSQSLFPKNREKVCLELMSQAVGSFVLKGPFVKSL